MFIKSNKNLLKEWNKIKDTDIFQSYADFAEFYFAHGEKHCYKKYTNEEWSKDNFFFGTYSELLEFYKTDTTITDSALRKIGQKYNALTILSLFAENTTGKKIVYAKCKCDCGNDTIKVLRDVVKGDVKCCGAPHCRQMRSGNLSENIVPIPQHIIKAFWDYKNNNDIDPFQISLKSKKLYWWKDKAGNRFQLAPCVYAKKEDSISSFPEQAIFYFVKKFYPSAINRANFLTNSDKTIEIDVYLPAHNIGIEYDGAFWHRDRLDEDENKNKILNDNGVFLIRVREQGLSFPRPYNGVVIERTKYSNQQEDLVDIINQLLSIIDVFVGNKYSNSITSADFDKEMFSIYALIYNNPVENNISTSCIGRFWDKEKNFPLKPEYISNSSTIPLYFKCSANKTFQLSAKSFYDKANNDKRKVYACQEKLGFNHCNTRICCPFRNLELCERQISVNCLFRNGYKLPSLKCTEILSNDPMLSQEKPLIKSVWDSPKSCSIDICLHPLLNILFENKSAFSFSIETSGSFWVKGGNIERFRDDYFSENYLRQEVPINRKLKYTYCVPDEFKSKIIDGQLILYHLLFKNEYMRGWRFYIFLIIDIDKQGNIINQKSIIIPKTHFGNLDFCYDRECDMQFVYKTIDLYVR